MCRRVSQGGGKKGLILLEVDGKRTVPESVVHELTVSEDGSTVAVVISENDKAERRVMVGDERLGSAFGPDAMVSHLTLGPDGKSSAFWVTERKGRATSFSLWHNGRVVLSEGRHAEVLERAAPARPGSPRKVGRKVERGIAGALSRPELSADGRRWAVFVKVGDGGRTFDALIIDGKVHEVEPCVSIGDRRFACFSGQGGPFVAVVGRPDLFHVWREDQPRSREFRAASGGSGPLVTLDRATGRVVVAMGGQVLDSAHPAGIGEPVDLQGLIEPPLLSDGGRRVAIVSQGQLWIDGQQRGQGLSFKRVAFSRGGARFLAGGTHDQMQDWMANSGAKRASGRLLLDDLVLSTDGLPEAVGFDPSGQWPWWLTRQAGGGFRVTVGAVSGPTFEAVSRLAFNDDASMVAYVGRRNGRDHLLVNHEVVAEFGKLAGWNGITGQPLVDEESGHLGTMRHSMPVFVGPRELRVHAEEYGELRRVDVRLPSSVRSLVESGAKSDGGGSKP